MEVHPSDDLPALQQQVQLVSSRIKEVVDQLQQARRETMLADRLAAVGEMAAGVAHELRNPLTSVKLLIQTAADGPPDHALSDEHIHVVLEQIVRMESTIQGLLDFARPPQMQVVSPRPSRHVASRPEPGGGSCQTARGGHVCEDWPSGPVLVDGDPEQLHQVFVNLLLNGVESMPEGGELKVAVQCDDSTDAVCRVVFCRLRDRDSAADHGADVRAIRHQQGARHRPGAGDQPANCRTARRQAHGRESRRRLAPCSPCRVAVEPWQRRPSRHSQEF